MAFLSRRNPGALLRGPGRGCREKHFWWKGTTKSRLSACVAGLCCCVVVALLLRCCYVLPPAMVGFCHRNKHILMPFCKHFLVFPAGYCGICCSVVVFCCWPLETLARLLSCDENVIFKTFVVVAKSSFDECFRFCELLLANHPLGTSSFYLGESIKMVQSGNIT